MVVRVDNFWYYNSVMYFFEVGVGVALRQGIVDSDNYIVFDGDINVFLYFCRVQLYRSDIFQN